MSLTYLVATTFLVHILIPVYRITEDGTVRDPQMTEFKTTVTELQDLLQSKAGVAKFVNLYNQIRQRIFGLRRERKVARVMQVATNPGAAEKRKMQRNVIKKDSRKRKDRGFLCLLLLFKCQTHHVCVILLQVKERRREAERRRSTGTCVLSPTLSFDVHHHQLHQLSAHWQNQSVYTLALSFCTFYHIHHTVTCWRFLGKVGSLRMCTKMVYSYKITK
ncbi:uncharacterized protein LACBIDRAFT_301714 [Laccaria bicolor S238N-H82]|uniref:Predicted protein n=1 Tax=Laccaria bicolor (strain S238N-H82 / ATCC MYA-4686) TaxID=486041 RepID=B0CP40_LACBS|nr:uncharacterized protein LACBIDRAFT_301714 [Laccaria bicolor S238N-H82]EDR15411.1 predicted protein [Laccaria bicolor S238N-H82]|eukprot:XP_001873619.1 predicted protein [Laccaria bicolor S238N-H82]